MTENTDWDCDFEDFARCPHCGEQDQEMTEYPSALQSDGDSAEMICGYCDAWFKVTICVSYSFSTEPLFIGPKVNPLFRYNLMRDTGLKE